MPCRDPKTGRMVAEPWEPRVIAGLVVDFSTPKVNGFHCLVWRGYHRNGYPYLKFCKRYVAVKSLICEFVGRPIRRWGLHHCDNRACVEPEHVYDGTHQENIDDAVRRARTGHGERQHLAKLTVQEVRQIFDDPRHHEVIAAEYGVSRHAVYCVKMRKTWRRATT